MKFKNFSPYLLAGCLLLTSCDTVKNISIKIETSLTDEVSFIKPNDVKITETYYSIQPKLFDNTKFLKPTGDMKLLVIPTIIPNYETVDINSDGTDDKEQVKKDIETMFNGGENLLNESVSSFYKKSSFNQLNLSATVTDWFSIADDSELNITNGSSIEDTTTLNVVEAAVNWAKNVQGIDLTEFDNDSDGYIDGVWLIYSAHNYYQGGPQTNSNNFFAYTSWGNTTYSSEIVPDLLNPIYNLFGWASWDFMYDGTANSKLDSHTFIHEMGHFLGLNDYYTDNFSYNPVGKIDVMDGNVGDLNSYSKMLLGWTKPYIVTGNASISLKSLQNLNNFIVIPTDNTVITNNEFDPFSEYLLIELYTSDGLFEFGSKESVTGSPLAPKASGLRIYHVDNRKFFLGLDDPYNIICKVYEGETIDDTNRIFLPVTNNRNPNIFNTVYYLNSDVNLYDEIRLIEATGEDTFSYGGYLKSKSLFKEGDEFNMDKYGAFFVNNKFNNGDTFTHTIKVGGSK